MNRLFSLKQSLVVASLFVLPLAQAATLAQADYEGAKERISADYKAGKATCDSRSGNAKDVCIEEAKGREKVARAELEYSRSGKADDQNKVLVAKAESGYSIAKEKCDDRKGNDKDVCVKQAKAVEVRALAGAKMGKDISSAKTEAAQDMRDADYKVAAEKCDAMTGDAKASCMASAKTRFGKN